MTGARARILVVDDDPDIRELVRRRLASEYEVVTAANGREAMEAIGHRRPDVVITDRMMPEMDGTALVERLRADEATVDLPVIMLSALGSSQARVEGLESGADDYLAKPFDGAELRARVRSLLRRAHPAGRGGTTGLVALPPDATGYIAGLSLPSVLQMLHLDRTSCELRVRAGDRVGVLSLVSGELVGANDGSDTGDLAVYEILSWQDARLEMREPSPPEGLPIRTPLPQILMEAVRLQDEHAQPARPPTQPTMSTSPPPAAVTADPPHVDQEHNRPSVSTALAPNRHRLAEVLPSARASSGGPVLDASPAHVTAPEPGGSVRPAPPSLGTAEQAALARAAAIPGALAVALVDRASGAVLGTAGQAPPQTIFAGTHDAPGRLNLPSALGVGGGVEDVISTVGGRYHLFRRLGRDGRLVLFLVLGKAHVNLGLARQVLAQIDRTLAG